MTGLKNSRDRQDREWWSSSLSTSAFLPLTYRSWNSPVLCSHPDFPWHSAFLQPGGHLITYRRCEFPEAPLCGPLLKVCFPPQFLGVTFEGLTDGSSFPTPPAGQAQGTEGVFWEQTKKEEPGGVTKAHVSAFWASSFAAQAASTASHELEEKERFSSTHMSQPTPGVYPDGGQSLCRRKFTGENSSK